MLRILLCRRKHVIYQMCPGPKPYFARVLNLNIEWQIDKNKLNNSHEIMSLYSSATTCRCPLRGRFQLRALVQRHRRDLSLCGARRNDIIRRVFIVVKYL